jgi:hypothetical protein
MGVLSVGNTRATYIISPTMKTPAAGQYINSEGNASQYLYEYGFCGHY